MDFLEKDLEEIIYRNSQTEDGRAKLADRGLNVIGKMYRQLAINGYGTLDLMTVSITRKKPLITIYELKKNVVGIQALLQACRYATAVGQIAEEKSIYDYDVNIVLIGRQIELDSDFCYLYNVMPNLSVITYNYDMDGIHFEKKSKSYISSVEPNYSMYNITISDVKQMIVLDDDFPF